MDWWYGKTNDRNKLWGQFLLVCCLDNRVYQWRYLKGFVLWDVAGTELEKYCTCKNS